MNFEIIKHDGQKVICQTLATYHHDENGKDYIVYTDNTLDENNKLKVYYSVYEKYNNAIKLIDIKDKEDRIIGLNLVKELLDDFKQ